MRGRLGTLGVLGSKPVYRTMYIQLRLPPGGKVALMNMPVEYVLCACVL